MKSKEIARRLSDIHNLAIKGNAEAALDELYRFRFEMEGDDLKPNVLEQVEARIEETEIYVFMSSPIYSGKLVDALNRMVLSINTEDTRKVETIILGLTHLSEENAPSST